MKGTKMKDFYRPREIAELGLIHAPRAVSVYGVYGFIMRNIKSGKLRARTVGGTPDKPYYEVSITDIEAFNNRKS